MTLPPRPTLKLPKKPTQNYICVDCSKVTTGTEAAMRLFNEGCCGHCGGKLKHFHFGNKPRVL